MVKPTLLSREDLEITLVQPPTNSCTVFKDTSPQKDVDQCPRHKNQRTEERLKVVLVAVV